MSYYRIFFNFPSQSKLILYSSVSVNSTFILCSLKILIVFKNYLFFLGSFNINTKVINAKKAETNMVRLNAVV
ncbi:MAG: hypothetical protein RLY40_1281 [Pseudomonadota bacterium]